LQNPRNAAPERSEHRPRNHRSTSAAGTVTTPELARGGVLEAPNVVWSLLRYGTDTVHLLPRTVREIVIGSASDAHIVVDSACVSRRHGRVERQGRKGETVRVVDLGSKNGTFLDGERLSRFDLRPGQVFTVGARAHRFLALNEAMHRHLLELRDI